MSKSSVPFVYTTNGGVTITRTIADVPFDSAIDALIDQLNTQRGALLSSAYEYPGRYKRWSLGFVNPPLEISTVGRVFTLTALNARGRLLLRLALPALENHPHLTAISVADDHIDGAVIPLPLKFAEEERSQQPSAFSVVRALLAAFKSDEDEHLGLYGAFGYDLIYQFEPVDRMRPRPDDQRDMVLYLPDQLVVIDNQRGQAQQITYDFAGDVGKALLKTDGLPRETAIIDYSGARRKPAQASDFPAGGYADLVRKALPYFQRGDLFEVVPGQTFFEECDARPGDLFRALRKINPSPYGFLFNLDGEYLVGASPEMYVRVEGRRVETCPISGTIARGRDAIEDADRILELLNSKKDESELTMCTDVDRNDKARVCVPGSVKVIGRRQIELYSHLIHTVDHVEGTLRPECDALDAFLTHTWAVTVTGAPKRWAVRFIEENEASPRRWYGGAVGRLSFDGNLNTGLTLRTIRLKDQIAEIRVGATLLYDSDPDAEERETILKGAASRKAILAVKQGHNGPALAEPLPPVDRNILIVDCEDSFVLTLADYFRQTGATVTTLRYTHAPAALAAGGWDLVVLSPGPGRPEQFGVPGLVQQAVEADVPVFGVCLGMQGMVEAFGGTLGQLAEPVHGKPSAVSVESNSLLFAGLPDEVTIGRYHSLYADTATLPEAFRVTAQTAEGVIMAVEHKSLPVAGVQFHPESIMSLGGGAGPAMIRNVVTRLRAQASAAGEAA